MVQELALGFHAAQSRFLNHFRYILKCFFIFGEGLEKLQTPSLEAGENLFLFTVLYAMVWPAFPFDIVE